MRNRIIHDYGGVDLEKIYDTVKNDLPVLLKELKWFLFISAILWNNYQINVKI